MHSMNGTNAHTIQKIKDTMSFSRYPRYHCIILDHDSYTDHSYLTNRLLFPTLSNSNCSSNTILSQYNLPIKLPFDFHNTFTIYLILWGTKLRENWHIFQLLSKYELDQALVTGASLNVTCIMVLISSLSQTHHFWEIKISISFSLRISICNQSFHGIMVWY